MSLYDAFNLTPFASGQVLSTFFLGIFLSQCYTYFATFKTDRPLYRFGVCFLLILNIVHTTLCECLLWHIIVQHLYQNTDWSKPRWLIGAMTPLSGLATASASSSIFLITNCGRRVTEQTALITEINSVVQMFYAHRIYCFNQQKRLVPSLISFGSLFQLAWSIAAMINILKVNEITDFSLWKYGPVCWLGGAAATDLLITSSMVWSLSKARGKIRKTNSIIDQLIAMSVGTNTLTCAVNFLALMLFAFHNAPSYTAVYISLVKLYPSSLLFWLNSRPELLEHFGGERLIEDENLETQTVCKTRALRFLRKQSPDPNFNLGACEEGVRVVTTASLRTDLLPPRAFPAQDPFRNRLHPGENPSLWRSDPQNYSEIQIVGGSELARMIQGSTQDCRTKPPRAHSLSGNISSIIGKSRQMF